MRCHETHFQAVSQLIDDLAASLRGQADSINAEQQTLVYDVDYRPGWASVATGVPSATKSPP